MSSRFKYVLPVLVFVVVSVFCIIRYSGVWERDTEQYISYDNTDDSNPNLSTGTDSRANLVVTRENLSGYLCSLVEYDSDITVLGNIPISDNLYNDLRLRGSFTGDGGLTVIFEKYLGVSDDLTSFTFIFNSGNENYEVYGDIVDGVISSVNYRLIGGIYGS